MERGEPLEIEVVRRMPRVHPRCGTNLMAGGLVFVAVSQLIAALPGRWLNAMDAAILGALTALFTWRSVGSFMQQHFTTRIAGDKHLQSGISAANGLEDGFLAEPPGRPRFLRRLWCTGMLQTMSGIALVTTVGYWLQDAVFHLLK